MAITCSNCERVIGKFEQPCEWGDVLVCRECLGRLTAQVADSVPDRGVRAGTRAYSTPQKPSRPVSRFLRYVIIGIMVGVFLLGANAGQLGAAMAVEFLLGAMLLLTFVDRVA